MFFKLTILSLVASFLVLTTQAAPELEHRQIDSAFNSLTSVAASIITGDGGSIFNQATSVAGSVGSQITSGAGGVIQTVTSVGGNVASSITSGAGGVIQTVTSVGGNVASSLTSAGGAIASDATNSSNAAVGPPSFGFTSSHAIGFLTMVSSALVGAALTF